MNQKQWMGETAGMFRVHHDVPDHYRVDNANRHHPHQLQHKPHYALHQQNQNHFQQYHQQLYQQHQNHLEKLQQLQPQQQQQYQYSCQQQHPTQEHAQQNPQQHLQHQIQRNNNNYSQMGNSTMPHTTLSYTPRSPYLAQPEKGQSKMTPPHNFDKNNNSSSSIPYPNSNGLHFAPAPNANPPRQNQDALEQLENNLKLVLNQQQHQPNTPKHFPRYQQPQCKTQGSFHGANNRNTINQHSDDPLARATSPISFQPKVLPCPISANNSTAPSLAGERNGNMDDSSSNSNASAQGRRFHNPAPQPFSQQARSPSISPLPPSNPTSKSLFALGNEFQPLSSQNQKKDFLPPPKSPSASLMGSWSEDVASDEVNNDAFMNNIFHAELKMCTQNKRDNKDASRTKPIPTITGSNQHRIGLEPPTRNRVVSLTETKNDDMTLEKNGACLQTPSHGDDYFNASTASMEMHGTKDKTKKSRKRNSKETVAKKKTKRKSSAIRKPKVPVLEKEPPIEEQIMALPSIALAPSLLASLVTDDPRFHSSVSSTSPVRNSMHQTTMLMNGQTMTFGKSYPYAKYKSHNSHDDVQPLKTFRNLLKARGHNEIYSIELEGTEYDVVPSPLQLASYGTYLVWASLNSDPSLIRKLLGCGLSPNPCNQFRDSILGDLVCRQGNFAVYKCFVDEFKADLRVLDGFGRTLLHHCCWAQDLCRPMVEDILQRDPVQIFLKDKQGKMPLEYVSEDVYRKWNTFLQEVVDKYWPRGSKLPKFSFSAGSRRLANGDLMDPPDALTPALAAGVASGKITREAVLTMSETSRKNAGKE